MKIELLLLVTGILMLVIPVHCQAGICQTEYTYRMEITRDVAINTFVLAGSNPCHADVLSPPAEKSFGEKNRQRIAIRLSKTTGNKKKPIDVSTSIPPVLFGLGSAVITEQAKQHILTALEQYVSRNTPLTVTGYTCDLGSRELNGTLALRRATNVADFLKKHKYRVAVINGRGKQDYVSTAPENLHINRRVEISVSSIMQ